MADPTNTIIDEIPVPEAAYWVQVIEDSLYCTGERALRIDVPTKATRVIADGKHVGCLAYVDFHRTWDLPPDVAGAGAPDRRLYVGMDRARIGEIVPALLDQFRSFDVWPDTVSGSNVLIMVGTHDGKRLYFADPTRRAIGIVDLDRRDPQNVGSIPFNGFAADMVLSPDDRFLYVAAEVDDTITIIDTAASPPSARTVALTGGPAGLAASADGTRLFVARTGKVGTGSLSVLDTSTMQGPQVPTGDHSNVVVVDAAGRRAYVANYGDGTVSVVEVAGSPAIVATITGFTAPCKMSFGADGHRLYVAQYRDPADGPPPGIAVVAI